ncbi:MAG: 23S rRNA (adenine(2503)-C(2))-methyltransferase RlmN [Gammaproteobacteria bacterium]|nr:23S rRNA (adenine(2503)-C(2))-methyltransferase RlmN [Gammaproteobacteria bacterium]
MSQSINLLGQSRSSLERFFEDLGEKKFRAKQLLQWIYHHNGRDFSQITVFSKALRDHLSSVATLETPKVLETHRSHDGTVRWLLQSSLEDAVEAVLIPDGKRSTLCISSQAGCALDCSFCATGKQGFNGNLTTSDIVGQTYLVKNWLREHQPDRSLTNVVFMGMGEPLLNFQSTVDASSLFMDDDAFGLSKRRVTISTAGVVPMIEALIGQSEASLAVSLHAANDSLRDELVPLNKKHPLEELLAACKNYLTSLEGRRSVTFEYTLIQDVNDQDRHAKELIAFTRRIRSKVNLIPFNPFPRSGYKRPSIDRIKYFQSLLLNNGVVATLRMTRGDDINAACGQLVGNVKDRTRRKLRHERDYWESIATDISNLT